MPCHESNVLLFIFATLLSALHAGKCLWSAHRLWSIAGMTEKYYTMYYDAWRSGNPEEGAKKALVQLQASDADAVDAFGF